MNEADVALSHAVVADFTRAIHELVLHGGLREGAPVEVRALARAQLILALTRLEDVAEKGGEATVTEAGRAKGRLLQFLYEAGLIGGWAEGDGEGLMRPPLIALNGVDFTFVELRHGNLAAANLTACILNYAILPGVSLVGAQLSGVDLIDADLSDADLTGVSLQLAVLDDTILSGATLTAARVTARQLERCHLSERTILPEYLNLPPAR
jgi:hypothetical protein